MFKKLVSVGVLSLITLSVFADSIEDDRVASVARAAKAVEEAKDALRAAHVRTLKAKIAANEMAVRRLKTKLATTKDEAVKVTIEERIGELTDSITAMIAESKDKLDVTIGTREPAAEAAPAPAPAAAGAPAQAGAGPFSHIAGIWTLDLSKRTPNASTMVITPAGEIPTGPHSADPVKNGRFDLNVFPHLVTTREKGVYALMNNGALDPRRVIRVSPKKLRVGEDSWTRVSAAVIPTPEMFWANCVRTYQGVGTTMDEAHEAEVSDFVKAHPLAK